MLILSSQDVQPCALKRPGALPLFGFCFQRWLFYFADDQRLQEVEAVAASRLWAEDPEASQDIQVLYQEGEEYRVAKRADDLEPMAWHEGLSILCEAMRNASGLVSDHRWRLRTFEKSFVGSESVTWISQNLGISRAEATQLGREIQQAGLLAHVLGEQDFADAPYYYRFSADGVPEERVLPGPAKAQESYSDLPELDYQEGPKGLKFKFV